MKRHDINRQREIVRLANGDPEMKPRRRRRAEGIFWARTQLLHAPRMSPFDMAVFAMPVSFIITTKRNLLN